MNTFRFHPLQFRFEAEDPIRFPLGQPGNILRGAFGTIFRALACAPSCRDASRCQARAQCAYARIFEPRAVAGGPSGLADWPRPFVFRAAALDGASIAAGAAFDFRVNVFALRDPALAYFGLAFAQLAREGLGPRRARARLTAVEQPDQPVELPLDGPPEPAAKIRARFLTATELKQDGRVARRPEFAALFARIRDRIGALSALYGGAPLDIDFQALGRRAAAVRLTRCDLTAAPAARRSSRTGQVHGIGGFTGCAEYEGPLTEFMPYLRAARHAGVGRHTAWGNGEMDVEVTGRES